MRPNEESCTIFADYAIRYGATQDEKLAKFALVLALCPHELKLDSATNRAILERVGEDPIVWKGAFFAKTVAQSFKRSKQQEAAA